MLRLAAAVASLAVVASAAAARPIVPDVQTPGARNIDVTQRTIRTTICVPRWTRTVRPPVGYTNALKLEQMVRYHEHGRPAQYEEDHLISLELGGSPRDPKNLWPEPIERARAVDTIEHALHRAVCHGQMTLRAAQLQILRVKRRNG